MFGFDFEEMLLGIPGLIIAMTFHEYAHARAAVSLGDFTPRLMGRLTLDPRAHIQSGLSCSFSSVLDGQSPSW